MSLILNSWIFAAEMNILTVNEKTCFSFIQTLHVTRSSSFTYLQNLSDEFRVMLLHIWHLCWTFAQPHWQAESCNGSMSSIFSWRQCSSPAKVEAVTTLYCNMTRSFSWTPYWEKNHKEMQCFVTSLFSFDTKRNIHSTINRVRWPHPQLHSTFSETSWSYNVNCGI